MKYLDSVVIPGKYPLSFRAKTRNPALDSRSVAGMTNRFHGNNVISQRNLMFIILFFFSILFTNICFAAQPIKKEWGDEESKALLKWQKLVAFVVLNKQKTLLPKKNFSSSNISKIIKKQIEYLSYEEKDALHLQVQIDSPAEGEGEGWE